MASDIGIRSNDRGATVHSDVLTGHVARSVRSTSRPIALRAARRRNREGDGTKYYCTELVAATLQHVGVLARPPIARLKRIRDIRNRVTRK
jgi:hypothetical protein